LQTQLGQTNGNPRGASRSKANTILRPPISTGFNSALKSWPPQRHHLARSRQQRLVKRDPLVHVQDFFPSHRKSFPKIRWQTLNSGDIDAWRSLDPDGRLHCELGLL